MSKANLIAALLLSAFVIDRLVAAVFFIGSYSKPADRSENNRKLLRFLFSGVFAAAAVFAFDFLRVLGTFWPGGHPTALLDIAVTWLVLVAGAERLSSFIGDRALEVKANAATAPQQKLQVAGTLQLDERSETVLRMQRS